MEKWLHLHLQCTLHSFHVLSLFVGRKCKIIGGFWELWELAFRMYGKGCWKIIRTTCLWNFKGKMRAKEIPGRRTIWVFTRNMQQHCASFLEQHYWKINNAWVTLFHWKDCIETALIFNEGLKEEMIKKAEKERSDSDCIWKVKIKRWELMLGVLAAIQTRTLNYGMAESGLSYSQRHREMLRPPKIVVSGQFQTLVIFKSSSATFSYIFRFVLSVTIWKLNTIGLWEASQYECPQLVFINTIQICPLSNVYKAWPLLMPQWSLPLWVVGAFLSLSAALSLHWHKGRLPPPPKRIKRELQDVNTEYEAACICWCKRIFKIFVLDQVQDGPRKPQQTNHNSLLEKWKKKRWIRPSSRKLGRCGSRVPTKIGPRN